MSDRPAHCEDEIEVTPEMIEAGVKAMWEYDLAGFSPTEWRPAMKAGFLAMARMTREGVAGSSGTR